MNAFRALTTAALAVALSSHAYADCVDVIRASRLTATFAHNSSDIETYARTFCSEYDSLKSGGSSAAGGLALKFLSASFATGSVSLEQVRERYCDSTDLRKAKSDAYRSYTELIAPGAYSAYEKCVALEEIGVGISIDPSSVLQTSLTAAVSYTSPLATQQTLSFATSPDVKCSWLQAKSANITLKNGTSSMLTCSRAKADTASYVQIAAITSPSATLSFPWSKFQDGLPVDQLASLRSQLATSIEAFALFRDSLKAGVVSFNLNSCPPGWREYAPAQGRFIRGLDKGAGIDPEISRIAGSLQADAVISHSHSRPSDVFNAGGTRPGEGAACGDCQGFGYSNSPPTGAFGDTETRPKNVALLFCILD